MIRTALTDLLGVEHPIVGFNRSPAVVTEVSRAGGYGVLGAVAYTAEQLDAQLTWIEEQLDGRPYGVDLLVPERTAPADAADVVASLRAQIPAEHHAFVDELLARHGVPVAADAGRHDDVVAGMSRAGAEAQLDVVFAHRPTLVANALGAPPAHLVERAHDAGIVVASLVGARHHAERQLAAGVDVLVAQGTEAGGHTGTVATTVLTPEIVGIAGDAPVLAAGGIASGDQMAAALALGAAGVWCGSVWLASHEDVAPASVKRKFLAAGSSDTVRSRARTGKPARQLRSPWHDAWEADGAPAPLPMPLQPLLTTRAFASSTPRPSRATRARASCSRSSSARWSGRCGSCAAPARSPARWRATAKPGSPPSRLSSGRPATRDRPALHDQPRLRVVVEIDDDEKSRPGGQCGHRTARRARHRGDEPLTCGDVRARRDSNP